MLPESWMLTRILGLETAWKPLARQVEIAT
jgi:hypothetical protein